MAILSPTVPSGFEERPLELLDQYLARTERCLQELTETFYQQPEGALLGAVLRFPAADGYALYLVEKLDPLTLAHIPFADAYMIPAPYLRGLDLEDVKQHVAEQRAWRDLRRGKSR